MLIIYFVFIATRTYLYSFFYIILDVLNFLFFLSAKKVLSQFSIHFIFVI